MIASETLGIYQIKNELDGKFYIGSSCDIKRRISTHKYFLRNNSHSNLHLQRAWNKYEEKSFTFSLLEECNAENLHEKEQFYIDSLNPPYNISKHIKAFMLGMKRDEKFKENLSRLKKGNKNFLGKTHTQEAREKISRSMIGNDKYKYKKTYKHTEETKRKICESNIRTKNKHQTLLLGKNAI
jgi:group I intron endonuclease